MLPKQTTYREDSLKLVKYLSERRTIEIARCLRRSTTTAVQLDATRAARDAVSTDQSRSLNLRVVSCVV